MSQILFFVLTPPVQVGFNLNRCSFLHPDGKKIFASRRKALEFFIRFSALLIIEPSFRNLLPGRAALKRSWR